MNLIKSIIRNIILAPLYLLFGLLILASAAVNWLFEDETLTPPKKRTQ